jgi:hypothetical protein
MINSKLYYIIMKINIFFIAIVLLLAACKNSSNSDSTFRINVEKSISNIKSIPLSTLGKNLKYVPLETDTACLIQSITNAFLTDSFIFISDYNRLLKFDINGKYLKQIGSKGRGPGEYPSLGNFIIDNNNREIYVLSARIILIYDFDGNFKRDFKIEFPGRQFILNENNELIFHPFNIPTPTTNAVYSWYIIDKMGKIQTKIANTLVRINKALIVPVSPLYMYNGNPYFMEFGVDTLYKYDNHVKKPYAIFQLGNLKLPPDPTMSEVQGINGKIWVSDIRETKKMLFVNLWWNLSDSISNCVFDKSSSSFSILKENGFVNDIDGGLTFWPKKIINDNLMLDYADAFNLIKYSKKKSKNDNKAETSQLDGIVKQLNETSNPVLIILRNK